MKRQEILDLRDRCLSAKLIGADVAHSQHYRARLLVTLPNAMRYAGNKAADLYDLCNLALGVLDHAPPEESGPATTPVAETPPPAPVKATPTKKASKEALRKVLQAANTPEPAPVALPPTPAPAVQAPPEPAPLPEVTLTATGVAQPQEPVAELSVSAVPQDRPTPSHADSETP